MDALQKILPWLVGLPLFPKIMVSIIISVVTIFILALIWSPPNTNDLNEPEQSNSKAISSISWDQFLLDFRILLNDIKNSHWQPDVVIGIGRSGAVVGGLLAGNLGSKNIAVIDRKLINTHRRQSFFYRDGVDNKNEENFFSQFEGMKILLVNGANTTGTSLTSAIDLIKPINLEYKTAVVYHIKNISFNVDYNGKVLDTSPNKYPWMLDPAYERQMGIDKSSENKRA